MIDSFSGQFEFLSNFSPHPVPWVDPASWDQTARWFTAEHAFQGAKTLSMAEKRRIFSAPTPGKAKRLGREVTLRPDWESVKLDVMFGIVLAKFLMHGELRAKLILTGDEMLVEGNHWHDNIWGHCTCQSCKSLRRNDTRFAANAFEFEMSAGHNHLGKILMRVRGICR